MMGGGFLKQMNDTLKLNRELLGKKKSVRDRRIEDIKGRQVTFDKETLENVKERVDMALRRNRPLEFFHAISRLVVWSMLALLVGSGLYYAWFYRKLEDYHPEFAFEESSQLQPDGSELRITYYQHGLKAEEALYMNGVRHQYSQSYYESGERFRTAFYHRDTLIAETYFYKSGDTIPGFPALTRSKVHHLKIASLSKDSLFEFDYLDGKVMPDTYKARRAER